MVWQNKKSLPPLTDRMPFQKGDKKRGGRVKGTPNKLNKSAQQLLDSMGCNPIEAMAKALQAAIEADDTQLIVHIADKLAPYHSPKLSASKIDATVAEKTHEELLSELDNK